MKKYATRDEARYMRNGGYTIIALLTALAFAFGLFVAHANVIALLMILVLSAFAGAVSDISATTGATATTGAPKGTGCIIPLAALALVLLLSAYTHLDLIAAIILYAFGFAIGFCIAVAAEAIDAYDGREE